MPPLEQHQHVQSIAKSVLAALRASIVPADTERSIAERAVAMLSEHGITETWYYSCPAFVLLGSRSCLSISGQHYAPSDNETVGETNLVTVDISPLFGDAWGDCARSFYIEYGRSVDEPSLPEFQRGKQVMSNLHESMQRFVTAATTFEHLHAFTSRQIRESGFESIDFLGNFGHSIVTRLDDRIYIEAGNSTRLSDVELFTFEPHIRELGGRWGFKHENIFAVSQGGSVVEI